MEKVPQENDSFLSEHQIDYEPTFLLPNVQNSLNRGEKILRKHKLAIFSAIIGTIILFNLLSLVFVPQNTLPELSQSHPIWTNQFVLTSLQPLEDDLVEDAFKCLPNGNGLFYMSDDLREGRNLPPGLPSGDGQRNLYGMGWAHQLYCLAFLRSTISDLMENRSMKYTGYGKREVAENQVHKCIEY